MYIILIQNISTSQLYFAALILLLNIVSHSHQEEYPDFEHLSDDLIHFINFESQTTWKAGRSQTPPNWNYSEITPHFVNNDTNSLIPVFFDSRLKWPQCPSIGSVREQAGCGSCWAFAAVEVLTDRFCISSNGLIRPHLSAEDVLTCNTNEADCSGGHELLAWIHMQEEGVVTGGSYLDQSGCKPYSFNGCAHNSNNPAKMCHENPSPPTPECSRKCRSGYDRTYEEDKYYANNFIWYTNVEEKIQREILENGPVQASMMAYKDFFLYQTGVYQHVAGSLIYGHSIKIIGWGVENNVSYWLVVNSWNPTWGDNGLFKILRGHNECEIESRVVAGYPKLNGNSHQCRNSLLMFILTMTILLIFY